MDITSGTENGNSKKSYSIRYFILPFIFIVVFVVLYFYVADLFFRHPGKEYEERYEEYSYLRSDFGPDNSEHGPDSGSDTIPLTDRESLVRGAEIFKIHCSVCHLAEGQGYVGPNLTDNYWIHGKNFHNHVEVITEGAPLKGMISWKKQLNPREIREVASYISSLQGTNPPNPKEPQGEKYE